MYKETLYFYNPWIVNPHGEIYFEPANYRFYDENSNYWFYKEERIHQMLQKIKMWEAEAVYTGKQIMVYVNTDLFPTNDEVQVQEAYEIVKERDRLFSAIKSTPHLTWLISTKNPQEAIEGLPSGAWPNIWFGIRVSGDGNGGKPFHLGLFKNIFPVTFVDAMHISYESGIHLYSADWVLVAGLAYEGDLPDVDISPIISAVNQAKQTNIPCWYMGHGYYLANALGMADIDSYPSKWPRSAAWNTRELPVPRWSKAPKGAALSRRRNF